MMEKLRSELGEFNDKGKPLDLRYLHRYMTAFMRLYKASNYVKKLKISNTYDTGDCQAIYDFSNKNILIYPHEIIETVKDATNTKFNKMNKEHIALYNTFLVKALTHECYHGIQYKMVDTKDSLASNLFQDSIITLDLDFAVYMAYYDFFPTEVNAEILGSIFAFNFLNANLDEEAIINNNRFLASYILSYFEKEDSFISPTEFFYKLIGEEKRYNMLLDKYKASNYERMILGLHMDDQYLDKLINISEGNIDVKDIKTYLKKK